jgi:polyhydroxybutyrate depolymerase
MRELFVRREATGAHMTLSLRNTCVCGAAVLLSACEPPQLEIPDAAGLAMEKPIDAGTQLLVDAGHTLDSGTFDAGTRIDDAGTPDAGVTDAGTFDAGTVDAGQGAVSKGCGKPATGTSTYVQRTLVIRGVTREYYLWIPKTYAPMTPYPVVFRWHGSGGDGLSGGLPIENFSLEKAIIVSATGAGGQWDLSATGPDVELFDTLVKSLGDELCVDSNRLFSYGFSAGGFMTNLLACVRGNVLRGAAPVAGAPVGSNCTGKVAAWLYHGTQDPVVAFSSGEAARNRYLTSNGCSLTLPPQPETPSPCVRYQGCAAPVVWCPVVAGHNPLGDVSATGAWKLFDSLK